MKKIFSILLLCFMLLGSASAYVLTDREKKAISQARSIIELRIQKHGSTYQETILASLKKAEQKYKSNDRYSSIIRELKDQVAAINRVSEAEKNAQILEQYHADPERLRSHWLDLYNDYRAGDGLPALSYDSRLEKTGNEWATYMLDLGEITHERNPGDGWYNYPIIEQWFQDRGVKCQVSGRTTSVENTGYHAYYCPNGGDCTHKAEKALGEIFQYYVDEKGLPYPQNAHYKTTVSPYLGYMGLGLAFKDEGNGWIQVYTAAHFCTEFE